MYLCEGEDAWILVSYSTLSKFVISTGIHFPTICTNKNEKQLATIIMLIINREARNNSPVHRPVMMPL